MWPAAFKKLAHSNLLHTNGISCWLLQLFASCMNWEPLSKLNEPTQSAAESMKRQTLAQNNGFPALPLGFFFFSLATWFLSWRLNIALSRYGPFNIVQTDSSQHCRDFSICPHVVNPTITQAWNEHSCRVLEKILSACTLTSREHNGCIDCTSTSLIMPVIKVDEYRQGSKQDGSGNERHD